jgi:hypothetical protein
LKNYHITKIAIHSKEDYTMDLKYPSPSLHSDPDMDTFVFSIFFLLTYFKASPKHVVSPFDILLCGCNVIITPEKKSLSDKAETQMR